MTEVWHGAIAQLGEHLLCTQGVIGSIPFSSTNRTVAQRKMKIMLRSGKEVSLKRWALSLLFRGILKMPFFNNQQAEIQEFKKHKASWYF